ncbi:hypothetical protein TrRE_jg2279, partial [Triparma retinervis]
MNHPTFDFESYIQGYSAPSLLPRLLHIAKPNPTETEQTSTIPTLPEYIKKAAHDLAIQTAKSTGNVVAFKKLVPESSRSPSDISWIASTTQSNASSLQSLHQLLTTSKSHLNKTATLTNYTAMGEELRKSGRDKDALRELGRAQAFCTNQEQTFALCYTITTLSLSSSSYSLARSQVSKARSTPSSTPLSLLCILGGGVCDLIEGKWKLAWDTFTTVHGVSNHPELGKLASPGDIALYAVICGIVGGVCRSEFSGRTGSPSFREWGSGELEGLCIAGHWNRGEYTSVMSAWSRLRTRALCDVHLAPRYEELTRLLRQR